MGANVLSWVRKNLFSSPLNALITVATGALLYVALKPTLVWAFATAKWDVIPKTARLLAIGPYPPEQAWRAWLAIAVVAACTVMSAVGISLPEGRGSKRWSRAVAVAWVVGLAGSTALLLAVQMNLWGGLLLTLVLAVGSLVMAFPLGVIFALARTSKMPALRALTTVLVEIIRGVPLVSVLFLAWLMVPLFVPETWRTPQLVRAIIGMGIFNAAYFSEYIRGGLQGVPKGQHEGAWSLGLSSMDSLMRIVLPQAIRSVIPGLVGQTITAFKNTSLVVIIGLFDLLGITQSVLANPRYLGREMELYLFLMLLYFTVSSVLSYIGRKVEVRMGLGSR